MVILFQSISRRDFLFGLASGYFLTKGLFAGTQVYEKNIETATFKDNGKVVEYSIQYNEPKSADGSPKIEKISVRVYSQDHGQRLGLEEEYVSNLSLSIKTHDAQMFYRDHGSLEHISLNEPSGKKKFEIKLSSLAEDCRFVYTFNGTAYDFRENYESVVKVGKKLEELVIRFRDLSNKGSLELSKRRLK